MSRNAAGTYTAPANSWNPAVEGSAIDEADWNATLTDLESALTDSLDRTGKGKITAHIDFDENASPGTPDSNVGRLYVGDDGGVTTLYFKDAAGNVYNLNLAAASGLPFTFNSTTTTNADPGAGKGAFNNATISSATEMALSTTTSGGADVAAFMATWDDSGTTDRGRLLVQKRTDASKLYILRINGANTDATGYKRIAIEYVSGAGSISNTDPLAITYMPPGSAGAAGVAGFAWQGAWLTSTAYAVNDGVSNGGSSYICTQAHTSGASTEPDVGASWASYWEVFAAKGTDGAGTGDVTGGAASSDGEVVFYSGTSGKAIKRSNSISGLLKLASGVASAATPGTDYVGPTSGSAVQKASSGGLTAAVATDLGAGVHTIYVPAAAMVSRTTNGAAAGTVETTTNKVMLKTLDFDTTTQELAQFSVRMPKSWNEGTVTAAFTWSHAATTTNFGVVWAIEGVALSDGDAGDAAFGTAQQIADTGGTTNMIYVTSATPATTIAGTPAAEDWVVFQVKRVPSDGSDTMAIDARLHGVTLYFTTDAITDA